MKPGDIVQITNENHHWYPCLIIVSDVKSFGCQGYVLIPHNDGELPDIAYIRLSSEEYEQVGKASIVEELGI